MPITYLRGDAARPIETGGPRIIAHVCNNVGAWGRGFVLSLSARWTGPEATYRAARPKLGETQIILVERDTWVLNMVAQEGLAWAQKRRVLRDDILRGCLATLRSYVHALGATVHMPRIGCGLAGGQWDEVEPLLDAYLMPYNVYVYDLPEAT